MGDHERWFFCTACNECFAHPLLHIKGSPECENQEFIDVAEDSRLRSGRAQGSDPRLEMVRQIFMGMVVESYRDRVSEATQGEITSDLIGAIELWANVEAKISAYLENRDASNLSKEGKPSEAD